MSLKVYFGNNLIDEEYYTGLTNSYELFNDSFRLGTTPSNIYKLSIAKEGVTNQPSNVILKENNTTFAELEIDNIEEQDYTYSYDLTDKMLDLEFYYDASEIFVNGKTTLLAIAQDICSKAGLTLGTTNFRGYNKEISWYDNRRTAREYIGFIAELNGGFARVENSTLYFRKQKTSSVKTIDIDDCENFIIGEYHKITRVVYELGALKYEFGNETGNTLYLNSDNVFITEESEVQAIYNDIKDFEFYSFETGNCPIDYSVKAGDIITFTDGTNNYPTIAQYELEYFGTWIGGYSLSVNTERQEETKVVGNTEKIKNLQVIVDRDANTITQLVETTEEIEHQFETLQDIDGFAEGKYIYLDDASDELITSAKFNGETSQETRSGINMLNVTATTATTHGVTCTVNNDKSITLNGTNDGTTSWFRLGADFTLPAGTYTLSNGNPDATYSKAIFYDDAHYFTTANITTKTFNSSVTIKPYIRINANVILNNLTIYPMIVEGTYTAETMPNYEQYGVMPSPDYPSEIENLEGRNLFDENQLLEATGWTKNAEGYYTGTSGNLYAKFKLDAGGFHFAKSFKENTRYILSWTAYTSSGTGNPRFRIYYTNNTYQDCTNWNYTTPTKMSTVSAANKTIDKIVYSYGDNPGTIYIKDIQLEEGTVATPYVPYNSLEVKIGNKNLANNMGLGSYNQTTGIYSSSSTTIYCNLDLIKIDNTKDIYVSQNENAKYVRAFWYDSSRTYLGTNLSNATTGKLTIMQNAEYVTFQGAVETFGNTTEGIQLEYGSITPYEAHEEQTVYFPLAEGQKLYEGSYLADDGIHNVRGQIVFDGSSDESWLAYTSGSYFQYTYQIDVTGCKVGNQTSICSHFKNVNGTWLSNIGKFGQYSDHPSLNRKYFNTDKTSLTNWKTWLSNNPVTVEYELETEEIIPYNTEQQAAWNSIRELHTYKTVTHIYSDAYAEIGYIKDNMLSDFETKASAQLTKNDVAQLKIENGRISSEVSSTQSQLNNYYTKNEADNNTNSTKAELQNIIQQNKTEIEQTTQEIALRVSSIETNGVDKIETSMGYTFNNEGLNIDKEGAATASTIDNEAFKVKNKSANENVFFAGYVSDQSSAYRGQTIVESTNLVVKNYLNIEGASRFQPYVNPVLGGHGTGAFDIG